MLTRQPRAHMPTDIFPDASANTDRTRLEFLFCQRSHNNIQTPVGPKVAMLPSFPVAHVCQVRMIYFFREAEPQFHSKGALLGGHHGISVQALSRTTHF